MARKRLEGEDCKFRELIIHTAARRRAALVFRDIHARFADGFDDNTTISSGNVAPARVQNVISGLTRARDPDHTVLAFNGHSMLAIVQAYYLAWAKKQFDPWGS
jgi:hypothetical protein